MTRSGKKRCDCSFLIVYCQRTLVSDLSHVSIGYFVNYTVGLKIMMFPVHDSPFMIYSGSFTYGLYFVSSYVQLSEV